ncbi:MAG: TVP38/TMEM64 family protein [Natronomonas sp.]
MHPATVRQLAGLSTVAIVAIVAFVVASPETVFSHADGLATRPVLAIIVLFGLYLVRPLLAWPISALSILLGYLYGPIIIPVGIAGAVVTTLPAYLVARAFEHDAGFLGRIGKTGTFVRSVAGDLRGVVAVRLAPLPSDPVSYAAGLAGVPLKWYVLGTALGETPWVVTAVLLGASAGRLTTDGLDADPLMLGITIALATVLVLSGPAYRRITSDVVDY